MFTKTMNVTRCSVEKESEKYNIFIFTEEDGQNFILKEKVMIIYTTYVMFLKKIS